MSALRPTIAVCMGYKDLFLAEPDVPKTRELLRSYDRGSVLATLGKLNTIRKTWHLRADFNADWKIATKFFPRAAQRAREFSKRFPNPIFFTRLGILAAMRLALEECPATGGKAVLGIEDVGFILSCCILMNDVMNPESLGLSPVAIVTSALHLHDTTIHANFQDDILRSVALFEEAEKIVGVPSSLNMARLFTDTVGLSADQFADLCVLLGSHYIALTSDSLDFNPDEFFIKPSKFFSKTNLEETALQRFFERVSISEGDLAAEILQTPARPWSDITPFQRHPLIRLEDGHFFCLDVACLLDKAGRGMYWTLREVVPERLAKRLPGAYGQMFERYASSLLPPTMAKGSQVRYPEFGNGDEAFDGFIVEGADLVVLEFKSSVLRADKKYSGDPVKVMAEIDKKFVTGDETGAKGVAQLTNSLDRFFRGDLAAGLSPSGIGRVYPVMVVLERSLMVPQMSSYLNGRFDRRVLGKRHKKTITPITIIDIENYERMAPYVVKYGMGPLLESYYQSHVRHSRDQLLPFSPENVPLVKKVGMLPDPARSRFQGLLRSLRERVFLKEEDGFPQ